MPADMIDGVRAAVWNGAELIVTDDVVVRAPGDGEVTVRLLASGICHSDLNVIDGTSPVGAPVILGHEGAGVVVQVGAGVDRVAVGDEVVISTMTPCNACPSCRAGRPSQCREAFGRPAFPFRWRGEPVRSYANVSSFASHVTVGAAQLVDATGVRPSVAALLGCAVSTGWGAVTNVARVVPGETVVVIGVGGIGVNAIAAARLAGAGRVVAVDIDTRKRAPALKFGADDFVTTLADVGQADVVIECSGAPSALDAAIAAASTVALVGLPPPGTRIGIDARSLVLGRRLLGSLNGDVVPERDLPALVGLVRDGTLDVAAQVTETWPLAKIDQAVLAVRAGDVIRAVIEHD